MRNLDHMDTVRSSLLEFVRPILNKQGRKRDESGPWWGLNEIRKGLRKKG